MQTSLAWVGHLVGEKTKQFLLLSASFCQSLLADVIMMIMYSSLLPLRLPLLFLTEAVIGAKVKGDIFPASLTGTKAERRVDF